MKRIHPEDPRVTAHALGELNRREADEVVRAALLNPEVQEAIEETREMVMLLEGTFGQGQLILGEGRRDAIRRAGRAPELHELRSASRYRSWGRVALITSVAAGLMLATVLVLKQIPVEGTGTDLADGGQGVLQEETVMRLLLAPAPRPGRVARLAQGNPIAPSLPAALAGEDAVDDWEAEYRALTRLLHEDPQRFFENVERVARSAGMEDLAKLPRLEDNHYVKSVDQPQTSVPIVSGTASYSLVERFIRVEGVLPPRNVVRVEELVNCIRYEDEGDSELRGVRLGAELVRCPWDAGKLLLGVLLQNGSEEIIPSTAALRLEVKDQLVESYRLVGFAGIGTESGSDEAAVDPGLAPGRSNYVLFELEPSGLDLEERWVMVKVGLVLGGETRSAMIVPVMSPPREWSSATDNFQTAAILAGYGLLLRDSPYKAELNPDLLIDLAENALRSQREGDLARREALQLVLDSRILLEAR